MPSFRIPRCKHDQGQALVSVKRLIRQPRSRWGFESLGSSDLSLRSCQNPPPPRAYAAICCMHVAIGLVPWRTSDWYLRQFPKYSRYVMCLWQKKKNSILPKLNSRDASPFIREFRLLKTLDTTIFPALFLACAEPSLLHDITNVHTQQTTHPWLPGRNTGQVCRLTYFTLYWRVSSRLHQKPTQSRLHLIWTSDRRLNLSVNREETPALCILPQSSSNLLSPVSKQRQAWKLTGSQRFLSTKWIFTCPLPLEGGGGTNLGISFAK